MPDSYSMAAGELERYFINFIAVEIITITGLIYLRKKLSNIDVIDEMPVGIITAGVILICFYLTFALVFCR